MTAPKSKPKRRPCYWRTDAIGRFDTSCGKTFEIENVSHEERWIWYCPYCGREVKEPKR